jgi:ABC-type transport system involved in multi-copper enzyme maturation permease subunit
MIVTTQTSAGVQRSAPIVVGRKDYLSVLLRLVGMDFYKIQRRLLSKMLLLVGTLVVVFIFTALGIATLHFASEPTTSFVPSRCVANEAPSDGCIDHQPATLADMQHEKQSILDGAALLLNIPVVWNEEERFIIETLVVLGIIVAGALVGGEYSLGTVRLMFTRGPTRLQFLIAKAFVLAIYVVPAILFLMLLGTVLGAMMAHFAGIGIGLSYFTAATTGHLVLYVLLATLYWYTYMLMTLFFATVGRSTVAGIVGPLVWLAIEPVLSGAIEALMGSSSGGFSDLLKQVPDYFLGNNLTSLLHNQGHILSFTDAGTYSNGHSLLVVAAYLVVFMGVSCWLTMHRDVTG